MLFIVVSLSSMYERANVTVCRILNKLTPEKFDILKGQLIDSGITSADILKVTFISSSYHSC